MNEISFSSCLRGIILRAGEGRRGISRHVISTLLAASILWLLSPVLEAKTTSTWPQPYSVRQDKARGLLILSTPYYTIEHDLKRGGTISRLILRNGQAGNLLVSPLSARVRTEDGVVWTDLLDRTPQVSYKRRGLNVMVTVDSAMCSPDGRPSGLRLRTTFEYRWGYIKIHREFTGQAATLRLLELCPLSAILSPGLTNYGYRPGITEDESAPPFDFGSNIWGKLRSEAPDDHPLETQFVPRSIILVNPGVEGLEWFAGDDLAQWELGPAGQRGHGRCSLSLSQNPPGLALTISPYWADDQATAIVPPAASASSCSFDFYLAFPLLEGHAFKPWLHRSFNRNRGDWVSTEEIKQWAAQGYQTVHCHHDGDYYGDGLFWRDGSYPPYPDMDRYDKVLLDCRQAGIRTATYFSNKELHPSTPAYKEHGEEWGRKDRAGNLRHNFYRPDIEFGAQMCLRSGWLDYLKFSIDRVLKNHPLDGVYYDWNVALLCQNPLHEGKQAGEKATGHWDIDELLDLMEWTRQRVGPDGLIIIHNTTVPMFATENFADYVVATEWGYGKWTDRAPEPDDLPPEWNLACARPRGVISYGTIPENAPRRLHKLFALEAFLGGVTPWPASPETFELLSLLKPLGNIESYQFADWRNKAVSLSDKICASAVYSRPGEAYLLLVNLGQEKQEVTCVLHPEKLPCPLGKVGRAEIVATNGASSEGPEDQANVSLTRSSVLQVSVPLDAAALVTTGIKVTIPGDGAIVIHIKQSE